MRSAAISVSTTKRTKSNGSPKISEESIPIIPALRISFFESSSIYIPNSTFDTIDADFLRTQADNRAQAVMCIFQGSIFNLAPSNPGDPQTCEWGKRMRSRNPANRIRHPRNKNVHQQAQRRKEGKHREIEHHGGWLQHNILPARRTSVKEYESLKIRSSQIRVGQRQWMGENELGKPAPS